MNRCSRSLSQATSRVAFSLPPATRPQSRYLSEAKVSGGISFQSERIGNHANLHRLVSLLTYPSPDLRYLYTYHETGSQHVRLMEMAEAVCEQSKRQRSIGLHGTATIYRDDLRQGIKNCVNHEACHQLGEGFYVAVGEKAEEVAQLFARNAVCQARQALLDAQSVQGESSVKAKSPVKDAQDIEDVLLQIKVEDFASMKGLVLPNFITWDNSVEPGGEANANWMMDGSKRAFIEEYDYLMSVIEMPRGERPCNALMQIKFNPRALDKLQVE